MCCYNNCSDHVVVPALSTCLNADSSPVEPVHKTNVRCKVVVNNG